VILFFTYYGEMAVAISPNPQLAAIMSSAVYSIWFIFAGGWRVWSGVGQWDSVCWLSVHVKPIGVRYKPCFAYLIYGRHGMCGPGALWLVWYGCYSTVLR
jgi:hypothetical protein